MDRVVPAGFFMALVDRLEPLVLLFGPLGVRPQVDLRGCLAERAAIDVAVDDLPELLELCDERLLLSDDLLVGLRGRLLEDLLEALLVLVREPVPERAA